MDYIKYKDITSDNTILWICGKPNTLIHGLIGNIKRLISPEYFESEEKATQYADNIIHLTSNTSVQDLNDIFEEPPFLGDHYLLLGDASDLDNKVRRRLLVLLQKELHYIRSVLYISNYKHYKEIVTSKKVEIGKALYLFRIPKDLYKKYARDTIKKEIGDKALNIYLKRTETYDNFILYLDKLKTLKSPITSDMVKKHIPDCTSYTLDDYLRTLIIRDRKTVHMKALNSILSIYKRKTFEEVLNGLEILMSIKKLTLSGYLLPITAKEDLAYLEEHHKLPPCLEKISTYKIIRYLEIVSHISLTELHLIYLAFLNTKPSTQNLFILTDIVYNRNQTKQLLQSLCNRKLQL